MPASPARVLASLRALGKPGTAAIYARHGVKDACYGVPYAALGKLAKTLGVDQALAAALWQSGVHDARVLACKVADAEAITRAELERWLSEVRDYVTCDALSALAARTPHARALALRCVGKRDEWTQAAGYNVIALLALEGGIDAALGKRLIAGIARGIGRAKNRAKHSMNGALIALGGSLSALRAPALAAARAIGKVEVDHGRTGCKTPEAAPYIERVHAHRARRTRKTGARTRAAARS